MGLLTWLRELYRRMSNPAENEQAAAQKTHTSPGNRPRGWGLRGQRADKYPKLPSSVSYAQMEPPAAPEHSFDEPTDMLVADRYLIEHAEDPRWHNPQRALDTQTGQSVILRWGSAPLIHDKRLAAALGEVEGFVQIKAVHGEVIVAEDLGDETLSSRWSKQAIEYQAEMRSRAFRLGVYRGRVRQVISLLTTLQALHDRGIGYGDLHPDNIMYRDDQPVLIDPQSVDWLGMMYSGLTVPRAFSNWTGIAGGAWAKDSFCSRAASGYLTIRNDVMYAASLLDQGTLGRCMTYHQNEQYPYVVVTRFEQRLAEIIFRGVGMYGEAYQSAGEMAEALRELLTLDDRTPPEGLAPGEDALVLHPWNAEDSCPLGMSSWASQNKDFLDRLNAWWKDPPEGGLPERQCR